MMLEAYKLGFNKVLWIDSTAVPIRDPSPLFEWLDKSGGFIHGWMMPEEAWNVILPATRELLLQLTGVDVLKINCACTVIFGLKMNTENTHALVKDYYRCAELGYPFLSCFPEEVVIMSLVAKYRRTEKLDPVSGMKITDWSPQPFTHLFSGSLLEESAAIEKFKSEGIYFYHRWTR